MEEFEEVVGGLERLLGLRESGAGGEESADDGGIVALIAEPTVERAVQRPSKGRAPVLRFENVDGGVASEEGIDQSAIAVPCGVVEGSLVLLVGDC